MSIDSHYDIVVVGSGFASMFFVEGALKWKSPPRRILIVEKGKFEPHFDRVRQRRVIHHHQKDLVKNINPKKFWTFTSAYGGGSNCWVGFAPRMLPGDFKMKSTFGVGQDWPITYDNLEPHYCTAERIMEVAGSDDCPYPRSEPYPLPPHQFSGPDRALKKAYPSRFFSAPAARTSRGGTRPGCCNMSTCYLCPVDAKFTIENGMEHIVGNSSVTVLHETEVNYLDKNGGTVDSVTCRDSKGREFKVTADVVVLGGNAIFNPYLLLKSGIKSEETGRGICNQVLVRARFVLDGIDCIGGSTVIHRLGLERHVRRTQERAIGFSLLHQQPPSTRLLDTRKTLL